MAEGDWSDKAAQSAVGLHKSLSRQLRRLAIPPEQAPDAAQWRKFLQVVSSSYADSDADRYTLERSIDISSEEMRALHDVLSDRARRDSLTGLPNRFSLCEILDASLLRVPEDHLNAALLFIDLDGFKRVNDSLGHAAGDDLLVRAADRIRGALRSADTVARLGGDEFVVFCREIANAEAVMEVARRIVDELERPFRIAGQDANIGASIGIAYAEIVTEAVSGMVDADELLSRADLAMYRAKTTGRSRFVVFDEEMGRQAEHRLAIENALRGAISRDELVLHYQPIFDLSSEEMRSVEALVRWERPGHGIVSPDEFIPIAECSRLITAIDCWVVLTACLQAASWPEDITVSVNLSARDLQDDAIVTAISSALHVSGLAPRRLIMELTETSLMSAETVVATNLARISALGVQLSIDDFGTGYSSLSYLRKLPTRYIKIDRSFVTPVGEDDVAEAIVGAIVTMAHAVGQLVVAEGVETGGQARQLKLLGCDHAQGYLFARPMPAELLRGLFDADECKQQLLG